MRLIDADALKEKQFGSFGWLLGKDLAAANTIDAVPVVRCKNCKFSQPGVNGHGENIFNCRNGDCGFYGWGMMETDFCSYGERKE